MRWLPLLLAGCTFAPGEGFVRLDELLLDAHLASGPRLTTADGLGVRLDRAELEIAEVRLEAAPAHEVPEEAHGHAHRAAEPYDEPDAWPIVSRAAVGTVDLLDGSPAHVHPRPAALPLGTIDRIALDVVGLRLVGAADDGAPIDVDLAVGATARAGTHVVIDRDAPERLELELAWPVGDDLLDDLDADAILDRLLATPLAIEARGGSAHDSHDGGQE